MEEQKMGKQNTILLNSPDTLKDFSHILKNAHRIIEDVLRVQFKTHFIVMNLMVPPYLIIFYFLMPPIFGNIFLVTAIIIYILYLFFMLRLHYKKNWKYPEKSGWGHYIKLYYWRAYFRNIPKDTFNLQAVLPSVMGDMIFFVKDMNAIYCRT